MSLITDVISILSPTDQREFVRHLSLRNKRHDTRNIDLFRSFLKGKQHLIKEEIGSNAYNVLNKRLSDRLLDFMATKTLESEVGTEVTVIKQILLARKLFAFGKYKLGFKVLNKTEEEAVRIAHYSLLNEIYHTLIEFSHHSLAQNQETLFKKMEANTHDFLEQEKLNMVYASVRRAFNAIEFDSEPIDLGLLLEENYTKYGISAQHGYSFQSLYQLALIADIAGAHAKDYYSVDLFFVDKIEELQGGAGDSEKFLLYHIDLLYSVANIYFRKKKFKESLEYLEKMHEQMQRYDRKFFAERLVKYATLLALNHNFSGDSAAASKELDSLLEMGSYSSELLLSPKLSKVMIDFQQDRMDEAYSGLAKFQRSDGWYERHAGTEWNLNRKYIEILLHIELGNIDYVDSRINSFVRKYGDFFKAQKDSQVLPFLKLVKTYYHNPNDVQTPEFIETVENSIKWRPREQEDLILMCFYAWLKSKILGRPLYETTLDLINS